MFLMKVIPKTNFKELWLCFLPVSHLMFISLLHFKLIFCEWYEIGVQFHSFACEYSSLMGLPQWLSSKEFTCSAGDTGDTGSIPGLGRSPGGGHGNPLQYSCLENPHGQRSLAGYSPWGRKESDTTELLSVHPCISAHLRIPFYSSDLGYILLQWWAGISLLHSLTSTKTLLSTSLFFEEKTENTFFNMLMMMFCKSSFKFFFIFKNPKIILIEVNESPVGFSSFWHSLKICHPFLVMRFFALFSLWI